MTEATPSAELAFEKWWNSDDVPPGNTADMVPRRVPYAAFMSAWECRDDHVAPLMEALERIAAHPVRTPVAGRSDLGIDPIPACQDIAAEALLAAREEAAP